jgi:taurine dioxygenase
MQTEKIAIGSNIYGLDIKSITGAQLDELKNELYKNRIIVIKNQELTEQDYVDFACRFGFPVPYLQSHYNHPDFPLRRGADRWLLALRYVF